jgi:hypothetical protein
MLGELLRRRFGLDWSHDETFVKKPILFGDYMRMGATGDDRLYEEVSLERLPKLLTAYQVGGWVTAVGPDPPARSASAPLRRLQRAAAVACSAPGGRRPVRRVPQAHLAQHSTGTLWAYGMQPRVEALGSGACRRRSSTGRRASR